MAPDTDKQPVLAAQPDAGKDSTAGSTTKASPNKASNEPNTPEVKDNKPKPPLTSTKSSKSTPEPAEDDFDALAKRFAALKKR
jgi:hypothetical protein